MRELREETSIRSVSLLKEIDGFASYELPDYLLGIIWKGKYKGQKQKWYMLRFNGEEKEIDIKTKKPEFFDWKWISISELTKVVVHFKLDVYKKIQKEVTSFLETN